VIRRRLLTAVPSPAFFALTFLLIHLVDHPSQCIERVGRNVDHGTRVGSAWWWALLDSMRRRSRQCRLRTVTIIARRLALRATVRIGRRRPVDGRSSTTRLACSTGPWSIIRDHAQESGRIRARQGERRHSIDHRSEPHHPSESWRKPGPSSWCEAGPKRRRVEPSVSSLWRHSRRGRVGSQSRRTMGHRVAPRRTRQHSRRQRTRTQRRRQPGPRKVRTRFERCGRSERRDRWQSRLVGRRRRLPRPRRRRSASLLFTSKVFRARTRLMTVNTGRTARKALFKWVGFQFELGFRDRADRRSNRRSR
jgi:hypothetical protein